MKLHPCPNCNSEPGFAEVVFGLTCLISIMCPTCRLTLSRYVETVKQEQTKKEIAEQWKKLSELTIKE